MVTLVLVKNPFSPQDGREVQHIEFAGTIAELKTQNAIEGVELMATVNGYSVNDEMEIHNGDFIVLYPAIEKGGKGGKSILGIIAAIALSVVSFGIASGGWLASSGFFAAGHLGAYMAAAAVMFLGSSLIGRFMGQKTDVGSYDGKQEDATYSWGQVQTMEGQNNSIALTYGKVKSGGQTIGKYVSISDNDEYLNWLVAAGEGELTITDIKLNDNDYSDYDNVSVEVRSGTNDQSVISYFNDTYFTKNLSYLLDDSWATDEAQGTGTQGLVFDIEFPNGLYYMDSSGNTSSAYVDLDIEYKISGGSWTDLFKDVASNSYGVTLNSNIAAGNYALTLKGTTVVEHYYDYNYEDYRTRTYFDGVDVTIGSAKTHISAQVNNNYYDDDYYYDYNQSRFIPNTTVNVGNFKVNTAAWSEAVKTTLENGGTVTSTITVTGGGSDLNRITGSSRSAIRKQFRVDKITAGEYEVRVKVAARQYATDNPQAMSVCYWTSVESVVYDDFIYPCTALIGIKAKATDQMNGSPSLTFMKERSKVWVYNGSSYVQKNATNPAWACYDLLHQARQLKNINTNTNVIEVRGVPADRMRYADFAAWAAWCDSMHLYVNIEINTVGEMLEVANQRIAPIGRGMVVRFGTKYGCIYDHVQTPVQMFGMGNIISGTFSEEFLKVSDRANCVEVTYTNARADYQRDTLTIYGDTFDSDGYAKTAQLTLDGCTSYEQAYREGKYQLMCNKYQLRTVSFEAGVDSIACTVGDVVYVSHDVPKWANSGRIDTVNGNTLRLPVYISDTSQSYVIRYRTVNDVMYTYPITINSTSESGWTTVTLNSAYPQNDPPQKNDIFDIAISTIGSKPFVVKSITRAQDFTRRISCIEYAAALYNESYSIPPIQYAVPATKTAQNVSKLSASQYQYMDGNGVRHGVMDVSWVRPSNGGKFTVLISTDRKTWTTAIPGTNNNAVEFEVKAKTNYYVKVITVLGITQSSGVVIGPVSYGVDTPPSPVTGLTYSVNKADRTRADLTWNASNDIDFLRYNVTVGTKVYKTATNKITITSPNADSPLVSVAVVDNGGNTSSAVTVVVPIVNYPTKVTGLKVTQADADRTTLNITWNPVTDTDLSQYEVRVGSTWEKGVLITKTKATKATYQVFKDDTYKIWVSAINNAGNYAATKTYVSKELKVIPPNIASFVTEQMANGVRRFWWEYDYPTPNDIAGFRFKYTQLSRLSWGKGIPAQEGLVVSQPFETMVIRQGYNVVMMKAVSNAGLESNNFAYCALDMGDLLEENVLWKKDFSENDWEGVTHNGVVLSNGSIASDDDSVQWTTSGDYQWNGANELMWKPEFLELIAEMTFTAPASGQFWIRSDITGPGIVYYSKSQVANQWDYSDSARWKAPEAKNWILYWDMDKQWSDRIIVKAGEIIKIRIVGLNDENKSTKINKIEAIIDVPDIVEHFEDLNVPAIGIALPLKTPNYYTTAVRLDAIQNSTAIMVKYLSRTPCVVQLLDSNGNAVSGIADITWQGYRKEIL